MAVFDCVTFLNEVDLLRFRARLLADVVDCFVVVEATSTFRGDAREPRFDEVRDDLAAFGAEVVHVLVEDMPVDAPDRWAREVHQRNAIVRGLGAAAPDDVVLVGDVDEIPDPGVVGLLAGLPFDAVALHMRSCYYRGNWEVERPWNRFRAARREAMETPQILRDQVPPLQIAEAGAHLSYLMDAVGVAQKFASFAHDELDVARMRDRRFLETMMRLRLVASSRDVLTVVPERHLGKVQQALLASRPDLFDFAPGPGDAARLVGRTWAGWRSRRRVPEPVVQAGDVVVERLSTRGGGRGT